MLVNANGGEAVLHPSNIHDVAYSIGAVDFTGDLPVILGPDGPSLGGFVCLATMAHAELWKMGQLRPGDTVRFHQISIAEAQALEASQDALIRDLRQPQELSAAPVKERGSPILHTIPESAGWLRCRVLGDFAEGAGWPREGCSASSLQSAAAALT